MIDGLSSIRVLGLATGALMLVAAFYYHRGTRWNRSSFGLIALVALALLAVSVEPRSVNGLADMLSLKGYAYGRLLTLAILSSFAAILLGLYNRARTYHVQTLLDRVVCGDAAERVLTLPDVEQYLKPIMVLIACLNEEQGLRLLLPRMPREINGEEVGVLVIDDGSTDNTSAVAREFGCLVARNSVSRGQGAALRVGYMILHRRAAAFAVTMDGDNQHRPEDLPTMLEPLLANEADFVIGSRILGGADAAGAVRSAGVRIMSRLISLLSGKRITDCSSGFRAFRMNRMAKLDLREDQYQTSEVIIEAAKKGLRIKEVPIYINLRSHGESRKGTNFRYGLFFVKSMVKAWWR